MSFLKLLIKTLQENSFILANHTNFATIFNKVNKWLLILRLEQYGIIGFMVLLLLLKVALRCPVAWVVPFAPSLEKAFDILGCDLRH